MSEKQLYGAEAAVMPEPAPLTDIDDVITSRTAVAAEKPYKRPPRQDLKRLENIVQAKFIAAEDHLWDLREDPSYFAAILLEEKEHRQEMIPDSKGKCHPIASNQALAHTLWTRVTWSAVLKPFLDVECWGVVLEGVKRLRRLQVEQASNRASRQEQSLEYNLTYHKLLHHLECVIDATLRSTRRGLTASPLLRGSFERISLDYRGKAGVRMKWSPENEFRNEFLRLANALFHEEKRELMELETALDELQRLADNETRVRHLISPWLAERMSDISILSMCQVELKLYNPCIYTYEADVARNEESIQEDAINTEKAWTSYVDVVLGRAHTEKAAPTNERFRYPIGSRRTRENVDALRSAESNLDQFWEELDKTLEQFYPQSPHVQALWNRRVVLRTPEYTKPAKQERTILGLDSVITLAEHFAALEATCTGATEHAAEGDAIVGGRLGSRVDSEPLGLQSSNSSSTLSGDSNPDQIIYVDNRALKVFRKMFVAPSSDCQPGEVAWHDFLHAIISAGFTAERFHGSAWHFTPTRAYYKAGFQFNEPYPCGKIPFEAIKRLGRRLSWAYGWRACIFRLAV
ncbi:MAG: hypothetical protein Q9159_004112 [Coniocarpon cinnabarinum]